MSARLGVGEVGRWGRQILKGPKALRCGFQRMSPRNMMLTEVGEHLGECRPIKPKKGL